MAGMRHSLRQSQVLCQKMTHQNHLCLLLTPFYRLGFFKGFFNRHLPFPFRTDFRPIDGGACCNLAFTSESFPCALIDPILLFLNLICFCFRGWLVLFSPVLWYFLFLWKFLGGTCSLSQALNFYFHSLYIVIWDGFTYLAS